MNRDYINWLTSLPNNQGVRSRQVNVWMAGYAPLPDEIDLEHAREMQERWVVRDCPDGGSLIASGLVQTVFTARGFVTMQQ
jgi:hypothetical protein|tara:strand:+ start:275 stop:517 length:243 start_codon:yes stop_codon:yes gene_type:complete